jgi:hypothetical protein
MAQLDVHLIPVVDFHARRWGDVDVEIVSLRAKNDQQLGLRGAD